MSQDGMKHVLEIPELLESILLRVDMATLLLSALRVSRSWHALIQDSPLLQQALFFSPVPETSDASIISADPPYSWKVEDDEDHSADESSGEPPPTIGAGGRQIWWDGVNYLRRARPKQEIRWPNFNPLLKRQFGPLFFDFTDGEGASFRRAKSFYYMPWTPRAREALNKGERSEELMYAQSPPPQLRDPGAAREEEDLRRRFTREGASWRRMLVSQPPPPALGYHRIRDTLSFLLNGLSVATAVLPAEDGGLRMGQLYDLVQFHAGHHELHSLWMRILWSRSRPPYVTFHSRDVCRDLLEQTKVVVELYDADDQASALTYKREPRDVQVFDTHFRCDAYQHADVKAVDITSKCNAALGRGLDMAYCIF